MSIVNLSWQVNCSKHRRLISSVVTKAESIANRKLLVSCFRSFHNTSPASGGRYGHRLVKLWEHKEYTIDPIKVYRTGGRLPKVAVATGEPLPGKVWNKGLGKGAKRQWFWVDHHRLTAEQVNMKAYYQERVIKVVEDQNRSGYIALVDGPTKRRWILSIEGMSPGSLITNSAKLFPDKEMTINDGDAFPLGIIPVGKKVCSVEFEPGKGAQIARSAGNCCTVIRKEGTRVILQMPSKREINVNEKCVAVVGRVSNVDHENEVWTQWSPMAFGIRRSSGRESRRYLYDRRFGKKNRAIKPIVVIGDKPVLQNSNAMED